MASKPARYKLAHTYGNLPKGKIVYLSLYHQPTLDGHRMVSVLACGKGAGYSVPDGILIDLPYDELDEE